MQRLKDFMIPLLQRMELFEPARERMALHLWPRVVGPLVARNTAAVAVRGGILFIRTASSAWMSELSMGFRQQYRDALNARLGQEIICDIRFLPPPLPPASPEEEPPGPAPFDGRSLSLSPDLERFVDETVAVVTNAGQRQELAEVLRNSLRAQEMRRRLGWRPCPDCGGLTEAGVCCDVCRRAQARKRSAEIRRLLLQTPWTSVSELQMRVPALEAHDYEREKRMLLQSVRRKLQRWLEAAAQDDRLRGEALVDALHYCMLRTGKLPHQLTGTDIRYALGAKLSARFPER